MQSLVSFFLSLTPKPDFFLFFSDVFLVCLVAEKLKNEGRQEVVAQETMEEVEDEEGNVYNRKTYEDLKRQGLI